MSKKLALALAVIGSVGSFSGRASARLGVEVPDALIYVLVGAPVAANVAFTGLDVGYAVQGKRLPFGAAIAETACSGAQLVTLAAFVHDEMDNPYVLGYTAWTAALATHGIVTMVTAPSPATARKSRRNWQVAAAPTLRGAGGTVTLGGIW